MRRPALLVLVLTVGLVSCSCAMWSDKGSKNALQTLRAAVDKTLAAKSLHAELSSPANAASIGSGGGTSIDFDAPDRARMTSSGSVDDQTIEIGDTIYNPDVRRPGFFLSSTVPAGRTPASSFLLPLKAVRAATKIRIVGSSFVVDMDPPSRITATVTVRDGYVARLRLSGGTVDVAVDATYEFSRFNAVRDVTPPPADKVTPAPVSPTCPSNGPGPGGAAVCVGGVGRHEVDLPHVAAARSTLQLRAVEEEAAGSCPALDSNPAPNEPATLPRREGGCLKTGPAALEVSEVKSLSATSDGTGVTLDIELEDEDAPRMDEFAGANLERQVALVILGRVVSAPMVHTARFNGRMQITGLTLDDAARVKAALKP